MITRLPNECNFLIFNNLQDKYKYLFSCILVNRQWCRFVMPILWSDIKENFKDIRLIKIFLLALNAEERALLTPFKIDLPNHPKPLFEYTSYITSINKYLYNGISNWIHELHERYKTARYEFENAVKCSLLTMFLRTSKDLKYICLNEVICNKIIFENLYENATITTIDLYNIRDDFKSKAIDIFTKILDKNSTLTSLIIGPNQLDSERRKTLLDALCKNNTLTSLNLYSNQIGIEEGRALAKFLCNNTTLTSLALGLNKLGPEGGRALAKALCENTTLTSLELDCNQLGSKGTKAIAQALCKNTTLTHLNLCMNQIGSEGGEALANALGNNAVLRSLIVCDNQLGINGGKVLAKSLYKNTDLFED